VAPTDITGWSSELHITQPHTVSWYAGRGEYSEKPPPDTISEPVPVDETISRPPVAHCIDDWQMGLRSIQRHTSDTNASRKDDALAATLPLHCLPHKENHATGAEPRVRSKTRTWWRCSTHRPRSACRRPR
jgi:hypothetical protein